MGLGLTTQLQRTVGTQIATVGFFFVPPRVNQNKRNSMHPKKVPVEHVQANGRSS